MLIVVGIDPWFKFLSFNLVLFYISMVINFNFNFQLYLNLEI